MLGPGSWQRMSSRGTGHAPNNRAEPPMINFQHAVGEAIVADPAAPAAAVAYPIRWLENSCASAGLSRQCVVGGSWSGSAGHRKTL